jgi:hypothetical protein
MGRSGAWRGAGARRISQVRGGLDPADSTILVFPMGRDIRSTAARSTYSHELRRELRMRGCRDSWAAFFSGLPRLGTGKGVFAHTSAGYPKAAPSL